MTKNTIGQRRQRYFRLSSEIAQMDNPRLHALFGATEARGGWGKNHTLEIGGSRVFVKRVPVTDREYDNQFSTRNLYELPTFYNYGVGSAGFGVFRELVAHIKTTNWILNGEIENFPLLYHYRIVPFTGEHAVVDPERHKGYVDYWAGNENIGRYMLDRANARHELLLFLEHIPHVLHPWLEANPGKVNRALEDLRLTIAFLRKKGVLHFDAHFHNILTDGEKTYLTDFGLVLDRSFDLAEDEAAFFKAHTHYDYGEVLSCLGFLIYHAFDALPESDKLSLGEKYGMEKDKQGYDLMPFLLAHVEELHAAGDLNLNNTLVTCLVTYRDIITLTHAFYSGMQRNPKKDTKLPLTELKRRLKEAAYL